MTEKRSVNYDYTPAFGRMKSFLMSYVHCRMVSEKFDSDMRKGKIPPSEIEARRQMAKECEKRCEEVHDFLESVETEGEEEKEMLRKHYYAGKSIEAISEDLFVSRSTAFRISKRAEEKALIAFIKYEKSRKSIA